MIRGRANGYLQPIVSLDVRTDSGDFQRIDLKLDTGFNGELGLSKSVLDTLAKTPSGEYLARFANGQASSVNAYDVDVLIDGETLRLTAFDFGSGTLLLGMKAFPLWTGCVEFKVNGDVTIQKPQ